MSVASRIASLVVDDMQTSRDLITRALKDIGITNVATVSNGMDALKHINDYETHLVFCDYNMPGMDGLTLLDTLRKRPATRNIGFIVVTGRASPAMLAKGQELRMNNLIRKPFTTKQLRECVERVVGPL